MVDLGQKKVDSHPPFFMPYNEINPCYIQANNGSSLKV